MHERAAEKKKVPRLPEETIDALNENWENNEITTSLYQIIDSNDFDAMRQILVEMPEAAHVRSEDGRG